MPGMMLALPVLHPHKPGHVLLKPNATLDDYGIKALEELGIHELWIQYPQTEFLLRYSNPNLIRAHGRLASRLGDCFDRLSGDIFAQFEFGEYFGAVRGLMEAILENSEAAIFLGSLLDAPSHLLTHSSHVCYLSLLMGLKLDSYLITERPRIDPRRAQNVENLGIGALFHDVGVLRLAPEVMERWFAQRDENDPEFRRHVSYGFDLVRGRLPATASAAVLHHHQRLDGSGFPSRRRLQGPARALAGREIHIFARIVAIAEYFERLRHPPKPTGLLGRREHRPVPTVRALAGVLREVRARRLDAVVFKALCACVPAYAPGTFVTLSDGRSCVVTGWVPNQPCRPTVNPVLGFDVDGEELRLGDPIDLSRRRDLMIVEADGQRVERDHFEPQTPGEFDLRLQAFPGGLMAMSIEAEARAMLEAEEGVRHDPPAAEAA
ncbi:MAG: HD domain-containing protein [Phycisphaeraceae bacterium]|nr:HD domain-containing protein [Phycisphaeraceae bacterium]